MKSSGNTTVARLICDEATAKRLADLLSESLEAAETAVAAFEGTDGAGMWRSISRRRPTRRRCAGWLATRDRRGR